jgi:hypothetical protein
MGDKTLVVPAMAVAHSLEDSRIMLVKVDTKLNLADALTKSMDVSDVLKSMAGDKPELIADLPSPLPIGKSAAAVPNGARLDANQDDINAANSWARDGVSLRRDVRPPQRYVPGSGK